MSKDPIRLLLLRHGEVASHRGDVPVTEDGLLFATEVGRHVAQRGAKRIHFFSGETLRTRQTADAILQGAAAIGATVTGTEVSFALRNPDLYVAGHRVNMVSTFEALAEQLNDFSVEQAHKIDFINNFINAPDRIGYWLQSTTPPGDNAEDVHRRIDHWAGSLWDIENKPDLFVAVTHSPVLRALLAPLLGSDPGEPEYVSGLSVEIGEDRIPHYSSLPQAP